MNIRNVLPGFAVLSTAPSGSASAPSPAKEKR